MTHSSPFLAAFIRGITATAPQAEDEERIERHSALGQGLASEIHVFYRCRPGPNALLGAEGDRFPRAA